MSVVKRSLLIFSALMAGCIPTPHSEPDTLPTLILLEEQQRIALEAFRNQDCLIAGLSRTVSSSGVLICIRNYGDQCRGDLFFDNASSRNALISAINTIALEHTSCSTAATNAIQQINQLVLPAHLLLYAAGGTAGQHRSSLNYSAQRVSSCENVGMQATSFLNGATTLADEGQMNFLASALGLVAMKDTVGTCRSSLGLTAEQASAISDYLAGSLTRTAVCDYGADDASLTDCPAALDRPWFRFTGISSW